jgi:hypothetical protein
MLIANTPCYVILLSGSGPWLDSFFYSGLTQYYKACYVPYLAQNQETIKQRICYFFESIKHLINVNHFVVDFAITPDRVYLVELNHWGTTASSSLCMFLLS